MDEFWIEKAHKYIVEHRAFNNVSEVRHVSEECAIISAELSVGLPARFIATGSTERGVRAVEPVSFVFGKNFPLKAPIIILRDDFPRCFPHINPSNKDVLPCIYEGDLSELLQQSEWMNGILNQFVDWMDKAASGSLINYAQGWEPMRNENPAGFIVYDVFELLAFLKDATAGSMKTYYKGHNGFLLTDAHLDSKERNKSTLIVCRSTNNQVVDTYIPNTILQLSDLYAYALEVGISDLRAKIESYDRDSLDEDKLFVVLAIKRPCQIIGSDTNIELLNFVIHKSRPRKRKKRTLTECKVGMLLHIDEISQQLLKRMSGSKQRLDLVQNIAILGCGSLGSKICLHLARNGNGPFLCVDNDIFLPHNNARHGLSFTWPQNKAELLSFAIWSISGYKARISRESALSADFSECRVIIDSTASFTVRSTLISKKDLPPVISCGLYGSGKLGIMFIEGIDRRVRLDDLWAYLYWHSLDSDWLRDILYSEQGGRVLIGQSCGSNTVVMSDANLSMFAASMSMRIQKIMEDDFSEPGEIFISRISDEYNYSVERLIVTKSNQILAITKKEWNVRVLQSAIDRMKEQSLSAGVNETGGCLIGSVFLAAKSIVVTDILPPPSDSISSPSLFILGTEGLESKIKTIERKTNAKVTYLGTWHSHPHGGAASDKDKSTAQRLLFVRNYEPTVCLIWTPEGVIEV